MIPLLDRIKRGEKIRYAYDRRYRKSDLFQLHREALRAKYGEPRIVVTGNLRKEYFELGDDRVIMFASLDYLEAK